MAKSVKRDEHTEDSHEKDRGKYESAEVDHRAQCREEEHMLIAPQPSTSGANNEQCVDGETYGYGGGQLKNDWLGSYRYGNNIV